MAKQLARTIGYRYIDSGAMYRAVTLAAFVKGLVEPGKALSPDEAKKIIDLAKRLDIDFKIMPDGTQHTILDGEDVEDRIRMLDISGSVSTVAAIPEVREVLVELQRRLGREGGIVMDGRDIGTTVFPDALMKVYVSASPETRARRRFDELTAKGQHPSYNEVLDNIVSRDRMDMTRETSPLRKAEDAYELDNSTMTPEQQNNWLIELYNNITSTKA